MRTALTKSDVQVIYEAAHRLKNTVVYLGAAPTAEATQRVEQIRRSGDLTDVAEAIQRLEEQVAMLKRAVAPHKKTRAE